MLIKNIAKGSIVIMICIGVILPTFINIASAASWVKTYDKIVYQLVPGNTENYNVILADESDAFTVEDAYYIADVGTGLFNGDAIQYVAIRAMLYTSWGASAHSVLEGDAVDDWIVVGKPTVYHCLSAVMWGSTGRLEWWADNMDSYAQTFVISVKIYRVVSMP